MSQSAIQSTTPRFPLPPRKVRRTVASGCALALPRLFILPHMIIGIMLLLYAPVHLFVEQFGTPTLATVDRLETRNTRSTVFYNPTNAKRSIAYEFSGLKVIDHSIGFQ